MSASAPPCRSFWGSDELRASSLTVLDEVRGGLVHFTSTLVDTVPRVYRDLERSLRTRYPDEQIDAPPLLHFGSWIGGDRDGNPFVRPETTSATLELLRDQCLRFLESRIETIAGRLSFSERISGPAGPLTPILEFGEIQFPALAQRLHDLNPEEPYRRALTFIRERVRATAALAAGGYAAPDALLADLREVEQALREDGGGFSAAGDLHDVIRQVEVFGFHFAKLDVRQHAKVHRAALHEVFAGLRILPEYSSLPERQRCEVLAALHRRSPAADPGGHIALQRVDPGDDRDLPDDRAGTLRAPPAGRSTPMSISGAEAPSDVLEVLLFMKESSLSPSRRRPRAAADRAAV